MRIAAMLLAGTLVSCSPGQEQAQAAPGAVPVACALARAADFASTCLVERVVGEEGAEFVVRHPDGGFRRFKIAPDRSGMMAADGADIAVNTLAGDPPMLEVRVAQDRYRFPADLDAQP
ncbi:hypothetical protein GRI40_02890 [Altererythrobacter aerius]|uniref:Lipoprotein n=1 Tax=Tsuneonella aeria TaxID=1837929 RepID=A0A6I4TCP2_9SPHN|nr:hypothetical protein [Tsuneonella aeria]MXO74168.1 hypothetical protein [Tsuneonella aeria]